MTSGVYRIINYNNGKTYVGSTLDFRERWYKHKSSLRAKKHENSKLQNDWNLLGEENFCFEIGVICDKNKLRENEKKLIDRLKPEYNIYSKPNVLFIPSDEFRERCRKRSTGKRHSEETKRKCALTFKGKHHSHETKLKMREIANKRPGRKKTIEEIEKIRAKMKGVKKDPQAYLNMCKSWDNEERRQKAREKMKQRMDEKYPK